MSRVRDDVHSNCQAWFCWFGIFTFHIPVGFPYCGDFVFHAANIVIVQSDLIITPTISLICRKRALTERLASRLYSSVSGTRFLLRRIGFVGMSLMLPQNNAVAGIGSVIGGLLGPIK